MNRLEPELPGDLGSPPLDFVLDGFDSPLNLGFELLWRMAEDEEREVGRLKETDSNSLATVTCI